MSLTRRANESHDAYTARLEIAYLNDEMDRSTFERFYKEAVDEGRRLQLQQTIPPVPLTASPFPLAEERYDPFSLQLKLICRMSCWNLRIIWRICRQLVRRLDESHADHLERIETALVEERIDMDTYSTLYAEAVMAHRRRDRNDPILRRTGRSTAELSAQTTSTPSFAPPDRLRNTERLVIFYYVARRPFILTFAVSTELAEVSFYALFHLNQALITWIQRTSIHVVKCSIQSSEASLDVSMVIISLRVDK